MNLPDFKSTEKTFQQIKWLKLYAKKNLIIQTHYSTHLLFQSILKNSDLAFYSSEIVLRKKEGYPPFGKLIKLSISDFSSKKAQDKAQQLSRKLTQKTKDLEILGPAPSYSVKRGGKYLWQLILKGQNPEQNPEQILSQIPKDWKIDIEPVSLL